jgi:hypothetical protein
MDFFNSNSTPVDIIICPIKMKKTERKTSISEGIAKVYNFSR